VIGSPLSFCFLELLYPIVIQDFLVSLHRYRAICTLNAACLGDAVLSFIVVEGLPRHTNFVHRCHKVTTILLPCSAWAQKAFLSYTVVTAAFFIPLHFGIHCIPGISVEEELSSKISTLSSSSAFRARARAGAGARRYCSWSGALSRTFDAPALFLERQTAETEYLSIGYHASRHAKKPCVPYRYLDQNQ
jgi:hypothetical protein